MRRYGKFVDARWIHQRIHTKDARMARELARRQPAMPATALYASSLPPARYLVGDLVEVLQAARLPQVEAVIGQGVVEKVEGEHPQELYWVSGFPCARTARTLRLVLRGGGVR